MKKLAEALDKIAEAVSRTEADTSTKLAVEAAASMVYAASQALSTKSTEGWPSLADWSGPEVGANNITYDSKRFEDLYVTFSSSGRVDVTLLSRELPLKYSDPESVKKALAKALAWGTKELADAKSKAKAIEPGLRKLSKDWGIDINKKADRIILTHKSAPVMFDARDLFEAIADGGTGYAFVIVDGKQKAKVRLSSVEDVLREVGKLKL